MTTIDQHGNNQSMPEVMSRFDQTIIGAVKDALLCIERHLESGDYLANISDLKTITYRPDGMPEFDDASTDSRDYSYAFHPGFGNPPRPDPTDDLDSFKALEALILGNEFLRGRLIPYWLFAYEGDSEVIKGLIPWSARNVAKKLATRYVHQSGTLTFAKSPFEQVYEPYRRAVFDPDLRVEVCVPLLFLRFSFEEQRVDEDAVVRRMTNDFQLARFPSYPHGPGPYQLVLGAATHMLVLEGFQVRNQNHRQLTELFGNRDNYPVDRIERFFAALRIASGASTGYCQLLIRPIAWSASWREGLAEEVHGVTTRSYPTEFDDFYWNRQSFKELKVSDVAGCGGVYRKLTAATENSISIAVRRLNRCYCRDDEDDWVLDATIALEALLLGDDEKDELVHKLALRAAAIAQFDPSQTRTALEVYDDIKAVYKLRSRIVHGKSPKPHDRKILGGREAPVPTSLIARDHLRMVLSVLISNPEYRAPRAIDKLILYSLSSPRSPLDPNG